MEFKEALESIVDEISGVAGNVDPQEADVLLSCVNAAARVFVTGQGRSGLVGRSFAKRLMHLGHRAFVVGDVTTPPVGKGDLLVAVSGSGLTGATCHFAEIAKKAGATVVAVVADPGARLAGVADAVLVVPGSAKTGAGAGSRQIAGSLFEQAALVVFDAVVMVLAETRKESHESMRRRHTNLE